MGSAFAEQAILFWINDAQPSGVCGCRALAHVLSRRASTSHG